MRVLDNCLRGYGFTGAAWSSVLWPAKGFSLSCLLFCCIPGSLFSDQRAREGQRNDVDPMDPNGWKTLDTVSPSKYPDEGLASGSTHRYRVRARGTAGASEWSDPAKAMAR